MRRNYGWVPDLPDHRDLLYAAPLGLKLPDKVSLRPGIAEVYDQGSLGSCTANALSAAFQFMRKKEGLPAWRPSRLFVYYNEREVEGTVDQDSGAMLRDGIKMLVKRGVCSEALWPYVIEKFDVKPNEDCYRQAKLSQVLKYQRVSACLNSMRAALAQGHPFVVGIGVFESFESQAVAKTGQVPMPGKDESLLGGHAVLCVGYDDQAQRFELLNSWGTSWGDQGFFTLPYPYLASENLADDRWVISKTE